MFKGTSKSLQNDILDSMLTACKVEIYNQTENSHFLGIQFDKTIDVMNWCQMTLILDMFLARVFMRTFGALE